MLTSKFRQKQIRIAFRPEDESFEVTDAAIEKDPEYIADYRRALGREVQLNGTELSRARLRQHLGVEQ